MRCFIAKYDYLCDDCNLEIELQHSMHDKPLDTCPDCGSKTFHILPSLPYVACKVNTSEIKTVGHLANRNAERMSQQQYNDRMAEIPRVKKQDYAPWWRPGTKGPDKSLSKLTKEQKEKYIMEGKKP